MTSSTTHMLDLDHDQLDNAAQRDAALLYSASAALRIGGWEVRLPGDRATWSEQVCDLHRVARGTRPAVAQAIAFYAPEAQPRIRAAFEACAREGTPYDLELEIVVDGARIWVRTTGQAERDDNGRICRLHGACQDISDKKQAEQALARSEQRFRELADAMPHLVWTADSEGHLNFVNRAVVEFTGLSRSQACGEGWYCVMHPDDLAPTLAAWKQAVGQRSLFSVEYRLRFAKSGCYRWCHATAMPALGEHGAIVWYGNTTDIHDSKRANEELERAARRHLATLESISDAFFTLDRSHRFTYLNPQAELLFGQAREALLGVPVADAFAPAEYGNIFAPALHALGEGATVTVETWSAPLARWIEVRACPSEEGVTVYFRDVSRRREAQEKLRLKRRAIEACANPIAIISAEAPFALVYLNSAFTRITGHAAADVEREGLAMLWNGDRDQAGLVDLRAAAHGQRQGHGVIKVLRRDGGALWLDTYLSPVPDADGRISHFIVVMYDVTAATQYQAELEYQSNYDALTGLANRNLLRDRAEQAIRRAAGAGHQVWLAYVNLDRFKAINDALGHEAGDQVLRTVAQRLQAALRTTDTAARIASDEFVALLGEQADQNAVAARMHAIRQDIAQPILVGTHDIAVTCSIGVAAYPCDSDSVEALINQANLARYQATQSGAPIGFYTSEMNDDAMERLQLENDLRHALERGELEVHYQPQVDAASGRIVGAEALLRWHHPRLGMVPPARFIPIAEETGMIGPIGAWVMHSACVQARAWQDAGLPSVQVAVNLSSRQFYGADLAASVAAVLAETGLAPEWLEIELTEGLAIENVEHAVAIMHALKKVGVKLSIDDFGTGYSSLSHLKNFPIDVLKVDQSFVRNIAHDPGEATIARTIIALGHSLGLRVIAEGVETEEQLGFLRRHQCDMIQGYHFSRPVPAAQFETLLGQACLGTPRSTEAPRQTLLVVDDEPNITAALERLLRGTGYRILKANSAQEGFSLLAQHDVQVILSDHLMPGMTGTEFLSRVRQLYPDTIRLMLSGYTKVDSIIEATNSGAVFRFHTKPWDSAALRKSIDDAFRYYWSSRRGDGPAACATAAPETQARPG
jgi:diguanylate cyclase (GGDEF)-like protein/PAS domain S-box-containing protein